MLNLPGYSSKKRIDGLAIFILKKIKIWAGYLSWLDGPQPTQLIPCSPLNNNENIAAGINWVGCGPSSPGQISSPDINFFQAENG